MDKKFLYKQVYHDLKHSILGGLYRTGDKLPSENDLCEVYSTTRVTIRQALNELIREGFIYKEHGKGAFVKAELPTLGLLSFKGFSEVVGSEHTVKTETLQKSILSHFPQDFFYELSVEEKSTGCAYLNRLRYADKEPVMLEFTYLPNMAFPIYDGANKLDFIKKIGELVCDETLIEDSLFKTLQVRFQIEMIGLEQSIRAIDGEKSMTELLQMEEGSPLLYISRKYKTNIPYFSVYSMLFCNTSKYAISNHF